MFYYLICRYNKLAMIPPGQYFSDYKDNDAKEAQTKGPIRIAFICKPNGDRYQNKTNQFHAFVKFARFLDGLDFLFSFHILLL